MRGRRNSVQIGSGSNYNRINDNEQQNNRDPHLAHPCYATAKNIVHASVGTIPRFFIGSAFVTTAVLFSLSHTRKLFLSHLDADCPDGDNLGYELCELFNQTNQRSLGLIIAGVLVLSVGLIIYSNYNSDSLLGLIAPIRQL